MNSTQIAALLTPLVEQCGLELDEIEIVPAGNRTVVRVIVDGDGPNGRGPDLDSIAAATRAVSNALDEAEHVTGKGSFTLEVSTRGTSRPLSKPQHWRRNQDRLVRFTLGEEQILGRIIASNDETVTLDVDGTERTIAMADAIKPIIQIEMNRPQAAADDEDEE